MDLQKTMILSLLNLYDTETSKLFLRLTSGELGVLFSLVAFPSANTSSLLAEKLKVSKARVATIISSLKKKGELTLVVSENDKRVYFLVLSESGRARILAEQKIINEIIKKFVSWNKEEDIITVISVINNTLSNLKLMKGE